MEVFGRKCDFTRRRRQEQAPEIYSEESYGKSIEEADEEDGGHTVGQRNVHPHV